MTVPALSNQIKGILTRAGIDNPDGDAREIIATVLGCSYTRLYDHRDDTIDSVKREKAVAMAERRACGEPIQYVIGSWSFMGREYKVGEGVLIPRDDTEVAVSEALRLARNINEPVIADLCSGSGIIAVTIERELKGAKVYAIEKSPEAYRYLTDNAALNGSGIKPILSDLCDCTGDFTDSSLDMIVSNPPYIRSGEISGLQSEVQYEPAMALDGGESGLDFYDVIVRLWTAKLKIGGHIVFEIGEGQYDYIAELLKTNGYTDVRGYRDIQDIIRTVTAEKLPQ